MPLNILWISIEDMSAHRLGAYGDSTARTPNIDRLASEGRVYRNAFSVAGVCAPSRSAIITGMYPTSIGTHHMRTTHEDPHAPELPTPYSVVPPAHVKTFTQNLRSVGYYCTNNGKTDYQFDCPFTAWDECDGNAHWRNREDSDQPFFAVFNIAGTHESRMWPREDESLETDPNEVRLPPYLPDTPKSRAALARHYDNLSKADIRVGELLAQLHADGLADQTLVVLWSDHGEGLPRGKYWLYDSGIRVPLIVRWPGHIPPGSVSDEVVSLIDLGPTMLTLAGVTPPLHLQGRPFLGERPEPRTYAFAARDRLGINYDRMRAVRDGRFKYIRHYEPGRVFLGWSPYGGRHPVSQELWRLHALGALDSAQEALFQPRPPEELYDCQADPWELHNLAEDPAFASIRERMRQALDTWQHEYDVWGDIPEEQMVVSMRPGGEQPKTATPMIVPFAGDSPGLDVTPGGGGYEAPVLVHLYCATQGASIAYAIDEPATRERTQLRWRLYTQPLSLPQGVSTIRARANRIGFLESEERVEEFEVH